MDRLMEILEEIQPDADYETCDTLIDDGILDSFAILSIVSELQDAFDITITPADIIPENFNSAEAMWNMIQKLHLQCRVWLRKSQRGPLPQWSTPAMLKIQQKTHLWI